MPYTVKHDGMGDKSWCVYKKDGGESKGCSATRAQAYAHVRAMYAGEHSKADEESLSERLSLIRAAFEKATTPPPSPLAPDVVSYSSMWIVDTFETYVVARCWATDTYWKVGYTLKDKIVEIQSEDEWVELEMKYVPVEPSADVAKAAVDVAETPTQPVEQFYTKAQADGRRRWIAVSSTAFLDGHKEIVAREGIDRGIERAKDAGAGPVVFWHDERIPLAGCDFQMRADACLIESGLWNETPEGIAAAKSNEEHPEQWGMSIKFLGYKAQPAIINGTDVRAVWTDLGFVERSILPVEKAATRFSFIQTTSVDGGAAMKDDQAKALKDLLGDDLAQQVIARVDKTNDAAAATGAVTKEIGAPVLADVLKSVTDTLVAGAAPVALGATTPTVDANSPVGEQMAKAIGALVGTTVAPVVAVEKAAAGNYVCPECGKKAKLAEEGPAPKCPTCDVAMKLAPTAKEADAAATSPEVLTILKELQQSFKSLQDEVQAIKNGEVPRVVKAGPPADPSGATSSADAGPAKPEVPAVIKSMAAQIFKVS